MDISVVVPSLNEEKYIERCMRSLRNQKFDGSYEIILGDGCSEDRTVKIAENYADKIVLETKRTPAAERQAGANVAEGEIIAFSDADAFVPDNWLREIYNAFNSNGNVRNHKSLVAVYGSLHLRECITPVNITASAYVKILDKLDICLPTASNFAVKADVFRKVGGFDTDLITCEEMDLARKLTAMGEFKYTPGIKSFMSQRRLKKWGYPYFIYFHFTNTIKFQLTGVPYGNYEPVR
ncbi:MAG: hypothetical protein A7316_06140 [Candidatus Altiarchaeales archaeon WOR_SM1_86-2]|nr:MAG: hypothetical protein A7316_06140 [Candidatus Altiarchaeales archaeon WOR_SM1_86-2]ODS41381.1 MAG: hypothetical protein A7315_06500 [Candidatus Altiarchaeales archaeon WOR_SM1_79]